ncbi:phage holin, lambda family [Pseudomonas sp. C9-3]|uniref:phage holin, lambda family n=1 Tax=Pseudomonas sp. C9-3 TaxID=3078264 RepID=UPI0028E70D42|nr:phage holin, lambda family [Pseudomonas sp. C9-3]
MAHMPDKPDFWAMVLAWLSQHTPILYAAGLSFLTALIRVIYGGGTRRQALLEAALCTLITLGLVSLLEWAGLPEGLATAAGVFTGFLGVKKVADIADRFADWKLPQRPDEP